MCGAAARSYRPTRPTREPRHALRPLQSRARGRSNPPGRGDLTCTLKPDPKWRFLREVHPLRKWGTNIGKIGFCRLFLRRKFGVRERTVLYIAAPPRHPCGPYFKATPRTNHGNPAVPFFQRYKPHLANGQKVCLDSTFFRCGVSVRSPHRATKPRAGVGFGSGVVNQNHGNPAVLLSGTPPFCFPSVITINRVITLGNQLF